VKVDERVLRILASADIGGTLKGLAARGARYGFSGWPQPTTTKTGKAKVTYLDPAEAERRAHEFLEGAEGAGGIAGRPLCLLAMASFADEDAIANSQRSFHHLAFRGPWAEQAEQDLEQLVRERIPEGRLPALDERLVARERRREKNAAHQERQAQARERLAEQLRRISELAQPELDTITEVAHQAHGRYSPEACAARDAVKAELARRNDSAVKNREHANTA
jgi:hypothetical protein